MFSFCETWILLKMILPALILQMGDTVCRVPCTSLLVLSLFLTARASSQNIYDVVKRSWYPDIRRHSLQVVELSQRSGTPLCKLYQPLLPPAMRARFIVFGQTGHADPLDGWHYIYIHNRFIVRFPIGLDFLFITILLQEC